MTKRMNLPVTDIERSVATYEELKAQKKSSQNSEIYQQLEDLTLPLLVTLLQLVLYLRLMGIMFSNLIRLFVKNLSIEYIAIQSQMKMLMVNDDLPRLDNGKMRGAHSIR